MTDSAQTRRCSFCHKPDAAVRLIAAPADYKPRAYICDECIAVCSRALGRGRPAAPASELRSLVEEWSRSEASGEDSIDLLRRMRAVIDALISR
jgi:hypothetical protein